MVEEVLGREEGRGVLGLGDVRLPGRKHDEAGLVVVVVDIGRRSGGDVDAGEHAPVALAVNPFAQRRVDFGDRPGEPTLGTVAGHAGDAS